MAEIDYEPIREVVIDAVTALRIMKHCNENTQTMVAGSILGLDLDGVLQVTYSFPFPQPKGDGDADADDVDGTTYQMDMMKMLRDVNIDNNCIGWYQSMSMGTVCTSDVVSYQHTYQSSEDITPNSIVIFYDTTLSKRGDVVLKAFHLSEKFMELKRSKVAQFIKPSEILEELPLTIRTTGHMSAYLRCLKDTHPLEIDCSFEPLAMTGTESFVEKHVETMSSWLDDVLTQQGQFLNYAKSNTKLRQEYIRWLTRRLEDNLEKRDQGERELSTRLEDSGLKPLPELPGRTDHLLVLAQVDRYTQQLQSHIATSLQKITLTKEVNQATAASL